MIDFPFMSGYCYAANSPILWLDIEGEGPGIPPKWYTNVIKSYLHGSLFSALLGANNTSNNILVYWSIGAWKKSEGAYWGIRNSLLGSAGEAVAADNLYSGKQKARISTAAIGTAWVPTLEFGQKWNGFQIDFQERLRVGLYIAGKNVKGPGVGRIFYSFPDYDTETWQTKKDGWGLQDKSGGFTDYIINYEVKTISSNNSAKKILEYIRQGIQQAKDRSDPEKNVLGVLVFDKDSWQKVWNDPKLGGDLKKIYNENFSNPTEIFLILNDGLFNKANQVIIDASKEIEEGHNK
jgi:hypothetical protein